MRDLNDRTMAVHHFGLLMLSFDSNGLEGRLSRRAFMRSSIVNKTEPGTDPQKQRNQLHYREADFVPFNLVF